MMHDEPELKDMLAPALRVLKSLGGQLVFADDDGEQFVLTTRRVFEEKISPSETQLPLPHNAYEPPTEMETEEDVPPWDDEPEVPLGVDDLSLDIPASDTPMRVRFEPIKGDLPPDLQE